MATDDDDNDNDDNDDTHPSRIIVADGIYSVGDKKERKCLNLTNCLVLTSALTPVTLEAAVKHPTTFCPWTLMASTSSKTASRWFKSTFPSASSSTEMTRWAISRHGSKLEWCSHGPAITMGGMDDSDLSGPEMALTSLWTAPVEPLETKMTASCSEALTALRTTSRASCRKRVDCREVTVEVVCVLP